MPGRNVMLESTSGTCAFEVPRNWKQAPTIFWLLPAWSSELETGMSHFFGVALRGVPRGVPCGVPLNPGVTGLKEAILEFFPGNPLARAPMPGRRGRASMRAARLVARPTVSAFLFCRGSTAASRVKTSITTRPYFVFPRVLAEVDEVGLQPVVGPLGGQLAQRARPGRLHLPAHVGLQRLCGRAASQVGTASAGPAL